MWTKFKFRYKLTRITGTLREDRCKVKGKGHPCTDTEALYRPYGPKGE